MLKPTRWIFRLGPALSSICWESFFARSSRPFLPSRGSSVGASVSMPRAFNAFSRGANTSPVSQNPWTSTTNGGGVFAEGSAKRAGESRGRRLVARRRRRVIVRAERCCADSIGWGIARWGIRNNRQWVIGGWSQGTRLRVGVRDVFRFEPCP